MNHNLKAVQQTRGWTCAGKKQQSECTETSRSTTLDKKKNHHRDSRREERCSTCDIMLDQARSAQGKSDPRLSATFALRWSRLIEHDITRGTAFFSPRISRIVARPKQWFTTSDKKTSTFSWFHLLGPQQRTRGETHCLDFNPSSAIWRIYLSSWSSQWPYDGYIRHHDHLSGHMTDISVIMIISVAVWRIYPSSWSSQWPYDGYVRHHDHLSGHMMDISVIMIISVAVWRIYPSSWSSQWLYDGYIRHGWMTSCGRGRDSATPECFGWGSQGTIFVRSSKIYLFFPELCSFRRVFVSCVFVRFGAKRSSAGAFGFDDVLELFLKLRSVTVHLFANSDYNFEYFWKLPFFFQSRAGVTCLTAMVIPRLNKAFWWWYVKN